jgi:hypothetical protein
MARSPYQGTFRSGVRPTVVHAPDVLVYINGELDVIGCGSCRKRFDINKYVTSVSVDLNVQSSPGSASVNLSIPRHTIDDFFVEGTPIVTPMMEIEIYAKGYYLVEGLPQYYPIFWGIVTEVTDSYSNGEQTATITCSDILKWWEICKMNINSAFGVTNTQVGKSIFGNVFFGMNPYDVIWTLAQQSFGDVIIGTGSLVSLLKEEGGQKQVFNEALSDIMAYWTERFSRIRSSILLYGVSGVAVRGDSLAEAMKNPRRGAANAPFASTAVRNANGGISAGQMGFDPTDSEVVAFRTQFQNAGQINFWQSEYQTKLELANAAKEAIGFEFYMDVTGDLVFKPPFFNLDVLSNKPVSWIQDIDIIDWSFSESEAEVVTQLQLQGNFTGNTDYGFPQEITPFTSVTDYHLLRKYGWRTHSYNSEFMSDPQMMFNHGLDVLDRINSKRHRAQISIPFRPELRLGFPVYVASKDQLWYIGGISHNVSIGGRAQTTLTLTARRQKFFAPRGIGKLELTGFQGAPPGNKESKKTPEKPGKGSTFKYTSRQLSKGGRFKLSLGLAATLPPTNTALSKIQGDNPYAPLILRHPKTGRAVGYPNVVMIYTRPFSLPPEQLPSKMGQKAQGKNPYIPKNFAKKMAPAYQDTLQKQAAMVNRSKADDIRDKHLNNRFHYGLNSAGVFVYAHDKSKVISEVTMLPTSNIVTLDAQNKTTTVIAGSTGMIRPVSDERGFEVIGHYRYGRGVSLRDGRLVSNFTGKNDAATIDLPLALTGDLFATLSAQSSGLTSITSIYSNPADTVARLQPEDLQTAGVINPDTKKPEFISTSDNFVDSAPLGSPENKGFPTSVEASQLSRALTIAELNVVKGNNVAQDTNCHCLLGRQELSFIQNGYQVKVLKGTITDTSALFNAKLSKSVSSDIFQVGGSEANKNQGAPLYTQQALPSTNPQKVSEVVNNFLFRLYAVLDTPHQEHEKALRGQIMSVNLPGGEQVRFADPTKDKGLKPPFSAGSRSALGDPDAASVQGNSNYSGLKKKWEDFGNKLQGNQDKVYYEGLIAKDTNELNAVQKRISELEADVAAGQSISKDELQKQQAKKAELEQRIQDNKFKLQQIPR